MELTIMDVVSSVGLPALKNLRTRLGIGKGLSRKEELARVVANYLKDNVGYVLNRLTPIEKKLVAEVAHSSNGYDPEVFRAKYSGWIPSNPSYSSSSNACLTWLFFRYSEQVGYVMPPSLASQVRQLLPQPPKAQVSVRDEIPTEIPDKEFGTRAVHVHKGSETSLIELKKVLALAHAGKLRVAEKSSRPTPATEKAIGSVLVASDFDLEIPRELAEEYRDSERAGGVRSHGWAVLVQQCGWCKRKGTNLVLTEAGNRMLTKGRIEDFSDGLERFILDDDFDELRRVNHLRGQTGRAKRYMTRPSGRRSALFKSMSGWPLEKWISIEEVYRFIRASGNEFDTCREPMCLYFGSSQYGYVTDGSGVDLQYLRAVLLESLATLGLVDVAYVFPHDLWPDFREEWGTSEDSFTSRYDGLLYVRLNRLGEYCLGLTETYETQEPKKKGLFKVLPNHEIVALNHHELPAMVTHMLESMAAHTSEFVWRIDRGAILESLASGGSIGDLQDFLETYAGDGVPDQVSTYLADIARKAQACKSKEDAIIIDLTDEESAAEIASHSKTSKICQLVGSTSLVVRKKNLKALQNALKKMGYILPL